MTTAEAVAAPATLNDHATAFALADAELRRYEAEVEAALKDLKAKRDALGKAVFDAMLDHGLDSVSATLPDGTRKTVALYSSIYANCPTGLSDDALDAYAEALNTAVAEQSADPRVVEATLVALRPLAPDERIAYLFAHVSETEWAGLCRPRVNATTLSALVRESEKNNEPLPLLVKPLVSISRKHEARLYAKASKS